MRFKEFVNEAAIHVDMNGVNALIKQTKTFPSRNFLANCNNLFGHMRVIFLPTKGGMMTKAGVGKASVSILDKVMIKVHLNVKEIFQLKKEAMFSSFAMELSATLEHELIHLEQIVRVVKRGGNLAATLSKGSSSGNMEDYYGNEHELMAYANTIIRSLQASDFTNEEILGMLRNPKNNETPYSADDWSDDFAVYVDMFKNNPKVLQRLYKYMYMYLTKEDNHE